MKIKKYFKMEQGPLDDSVQILVTGGTGLIGSAIRDLVTQHTNLTVLGTWTFLSSKDADLRNFQETRQLFLKHRPTYVIHLAAKVGGLYKNLNEKISMYEDNMAINRNIVKLCDEFDVKRAVLCLSTCVFPDRTTYPIKEEYLHMGPPHSSNEGYVSSYSPINTYVFIGTHMPKE